MRHFLKLRPLLILAQTTSTKNAFNYNLIKKVYFSRKIAAISYTEMKKKTLFLLFDGTKKYKKPKMLDRTMFRFLDLMAASLRIFYLIGILPR